MKNVLKKLNKVMDEVGRIPKNGRNDFHHYDYVMESDTTDKVRESFVKHGLVLIPDSEEISVRERVDKDGVLVPDITRLKIKVTIYDTETAESLSFNVYGEGLDSGDKGVYKAFTGAMKYGLLKSLLISTGDDPEQENTHEKQMRSQGKAPKVPVLVTGETYPIKDQIGKLGGRWNTKAKVWQVPGEKKADLIELCKQHPGIKVDGVDYHAVAHDKGMPTDDGNLKERAKNKANQKPVNSPTEAKEGSAGAKKDFKSVVNQLKADLEFLTGDDEEYGKVLDAFGIDDPVDLTDRQLQEDFYKDLYQTVERIKKQSMV